MAEKFKKLTEVSNLRLNKALPAEFDDAAAIRKRGIFVAELLCASLLAPPSVSDGGAVASPMVVAVPYESLEANGDAAEAADDDSAPEPTTARRRSSFGAQIREALKAAGGGPLTFVEIADAAAANSDGGVPRKTVRYLLSTWAVSGVRPTTKDGKIAGPSSDANSRNTSRRPRDGE